MSQSQRTAGFSPTCSRLGHGRYVILVTERFRGRGQEGPSGLCTAGPGHGGRSLSVPETRVSPHRLSPTHSRCVSLSSRLCPGLCGSHSPGA